MVFDSEVRNYVLYFFLQDLRQTYYHQGANYGNTLEYISKRIRAILQNRGWTKELLNKFRVNEDMINSVSQELHKEGFIKHFINTNTESSFFKKTTTKITYYRITPEGLKYIKQVRIPQNPIHNMLINNRNFIKK